MLMTDERCDVTTKHRSAKIVVIFKGLLLIKGE